MSTDQFGAFESVSQHGEEVQRLRGEVARLELKVSQLDRLAHEDSLVRLPNRRGLLRSLEKLIARVTRYGDDAAFLFIDINGLKRINDNFGHPAGDEALLHVAECLVQGVRASDCVARIGGDEFAVLLEHADEATARDTAARLIGQVAECRFSYNGNEMPLNVAIGITQIVAGDNPAEVMLRADQQMYRMKAKR
ncbi:MAG: GGDEF domain-containing protein [Sphingomicrobium sp.]